MDRVWSGNGVIENKEKYIVELFKLINRQCNIDSDRVVCMYIQAVVWEYSDKPVNTEEEKIFLSCKAFIPYKKIYRNFWRDKKKCNNKEMRDFLSAVVLFRYRIISDVEKRMWAGVFVRLNIKIG